jgi:hypothetical protein
MLFYLLKIESFKIRHIIKITCKYIKNNVLYSNLPPLSADWRREGEKKGVSTYDQKGKRRGCVRVILGGKMEVIGFLDEIPMSWRGAKKALLLIEFLSNKLWRR